MDIEQQTPHTTEHPSAAGPVTDSPAAAHQAAVHSAAAHQAAENSTADGMTAPTPDAAEWEAEVAAVWAAEEVDDEQRLERMRLVAARAPHPALGAFELGGAFDSSGHEAEADQQYAAATREGLAELDPARAAQLAIQHASTLRNLGRVEEAIAMLRDAPQHPATGQAPAVFLALALHSAGRSAEALRVALEAIEASLPRYHRSVRAYAAALTEEPTA